MSNTHNTTVRLARLGDAPAITIIYNQGIEERNATFETEPRTIAQVTAQLTGKGNTILQWWWSAMARWWPGPVRVSIGAGPVMRALRSTRCTSSAVRAAREQDVSLSYTSVASMQTWDSGNSCPGSFRKIRRVWRCMSASAFGWSGYIIAMANSMECGVTALSWRNSSARPPRLP